MWTQQFEVFRKPVPVVLGLNGTTRHVIEGGAGQGVEKQRVLEYLEVCCMQLQVLLSTWAGAERHNVLCHVHQALCAMPCL